MDLNPDSDTVLLFGSNEVLASLALVYLDPAIGD
jgi:hypothetical protein